MKKIGALLLAIVMVLAIATTAFAAGETERTTETTDTYSGSGQEEATNMAGKSAIPLTKSIVFVNENGSAVFEPNISFKYAVEPATIEESTYTITDEENVQAYVHPGPAGGVKDTTIAFSSDGTEAVSTAKKGVEVERTGAFELDINKFKRPGVYRYKITETPTPSDVTEKGLTARTGSYDNIRYLDVYIHRKNDSDDLEMYGAVIYKSSSKTGKDDITDSDKIKTTGYEPSTEDDLLKDDATVDRYTTYDFTVQKTVSGSLADKGNEFPFFVTVTNSINGAKFTYTADANETFTGAAMENGVVTLNAADFLIGSDAKTSALALKHNEKIKLVGVPSKQATSSQLTVVVKEFNNTYDSYTPSVTAKNGDISMITATAMSAQEGFDQTSAFDIKANDVDEQLITINNNLDEISPTGVVLRVAPYAMILVAGLALMVISRRRNAVESDEE